MIAQTKKATPVSTWQAVVGTPITDQFLEWPPDLFALTDLILTRSEAYRFVLSPPSGMKWPPVRFLNWSDAVEQASRQWSVWVENRYGPIPDLLAEEWKVFRERAEIPLEELAEGHDWRMCEALLTLHAIADEACAGLGVALDRSDGKGCLYRAWGRELLARTGSLARIQTHFLRVLPKIRTPPNGTSWRSFSRYACVQRPGVEVRWYRAPARRSGTEPRARNANLLLLPWPLRVRESDFHPLKGSAQRLAKDPFGLFEFAPSEKLDLDLVSRTIAAARDEVDSVDVVLLPESAIDESEVNDLEALLDRHGVTQLVTGVRQGTPPPGQLPGNWVHIGVNPKLEKGAPLPQCTGEEWFHIRQNKHHRWSLDEGQVSQYHLGGALHPHIRWWEAMDVPRQSLRFLELGDDIILVSLVCEDLAQIDEVGEIIRSVGPTLVFTPLLDGPQLNSRWAARYASVLADDPGSAVLTLTSFGMAQRCRPNGLDSVPVVALWKDPVRGVREIPLEPGAQGVLLTVCGDRSTRRTADGRWPVDNASHHFDAAVYQVRAVNAPRGASNSQFERLAPSVLEVGELTVLTGWAQAIAEALAGAPGYINTLLANANPNAPWRTALQVAEPSQRLTAALSSLGRAIHAVTPLGDTPTTDALLCSCREERLDERGIDRLVRGVLRCALEQLRTRQTMETLYLNGYGATYKASADAEEI